jgi:hypothetical protein
MDMGEEAAQEATDLRFLIAVRDSAHLENVLRALNRTTSVLAAQAGSDPASLKLTSSRSNASRVADTIAPRSPLNAGWRD